MSITTSRLAKQTLDVRRKMIVACIYLLPLDRFFSLGGGGIRSENNCPSKSPRKHYLGLMICGITTDGQSCQAHMMADLGLYKCMLHSGRGGKGDGLVISPCIALLHLCTIGSYCNAKRKKIEDLLGALSPQSTLDAPLVGASTSPLVAEESKFY